MKRIYLFILTAILLGYTSNVFAQSVSFAYTGSIVNWTVPAGYGLIGITATGGSGGGSGGKGAIIYGSVAVTPGQVLQVLVGQAGNSNSGYGNGGGGGGTFVVGAGNTPLVIAGGGGGQGESGSPGQNAQLTTSGGSIGLQGELGGTGGNGGAFGGNGSGGGCGAIGHGGGGLLTNGGGPAGTGGAAFVNGGAGGQDNNIDNCVVASWGGFGGGGASGNGGGGGGGYSGGAGGTNLSPYPGGGGGGSYCGGTLLSSAIASVTGNGSVMITSLCVPPTNGTTSGAGSVCVGLSTPYATTATAGLTGVWSSTNTSVATVNAATGVVTGVSAGTSTITYTIVLSCGSASSSPKVINVNPLPASISGPANGCLGLTTPLSDATPGGAWSSGTTTVATVNASTGLLTGLALGTSIVTYKITATGCIFTQTETVNPLPTVYFVTGGGTYCSGGTGFPIMLSNTDAGVNYQLYNAGSKVGVPAAGSGSPYSFGLETLGGAYAVIATNASTGCPITMSGSPSITINPLPTPYTVTISGGGSYCAGGTGLDIQLIQSDPGNTYQLYAGAMPVGIPLSSSTSAALDFGSQTAGGNYTVVGTNTSTTCSGNMLNSVTVNINPLPNIYTVLGGGSFCATGGGVDVRLSGSDAGINYELFVSGVTTGIIKPGTGSSLDFGLISMTGPCTIVATNAVTKCTINMSSGVSVSINPLPTPYPVSGGGNYCPSGTGPHVMLSPSSLSGVTYKLYRGGTLAGSLTGTGGTLDFGAQTIPGGIPGGPADTFTVTGTNTTTGCISTMTGNAVIGISKPPTAYLVTGGAPFCAGGSGTPVGLINSDAGTSYQLLIGGIAVPDPAILSTGGSLTFGLRKIAGVYTVTGTNGLSCTNTMSGSATVSINAAPTAYTLETSAPSYCAGDPGVMVKLDSSDIGIKYQLYAGGSLLTGTLTNLPGTGLNLNFGVRTAGTYTVIGTNKTTGCTNMMSGSPLVTINPLPGIDTVTGGGSYCVSGTGAHVGLSFSAIGVNYQLYLNGAAKGGSLAGTGGTFDFGLETGIGTYTVIAKNAATGCPANMAGSTTVSTTPLPTIYAMTGGGNYCAGSGGVSVGLKASNTGINYQLYNGAVPVGGTVHGTGLALDFGLQTITGIYTVTADNAVTSCSSNMSGSEIVNVNLLPAIQTVTGGGNYCAGGAGKDVSLGASEIGVNYQLYNGVTKTGLAVGGTGSPLDFGNKSTGSYTVIATDAVTGCSTPMSGSAVINTDPLPLLFTVSGGGSFCSGGAGEHILLSGSDAGASYQLYDNGSTAGMPAAVTGTGIALDFGAQTAGGVYTVVGMNTVTGCTGNMLSGVSVIVNPLPSIDTVTGGGSYCAGGTGKSIQLNTSSVGITYQLLIGGTTSVGFPTWGSGSSLDLGVHTTAGTYTVAAINAATGCTSTMYADAVISITPVVTPSVSVSADLGLTVCDATSVMYTATPVNGGTTPVYTWYVNGAVVTGDDTSTMSTIPVKTGDVIKVTLASSEACPLPGSAGSSVTMTVNPHGTPGISISEDPGASVCKGQPVTFGAVSPSFGGLSPKYIWSVGGVIQDSGLSYTYVPVNSDVVSVQMNSNDPCALADSAVSNVTMTVQSAVAPAFTIQSKPSGSLVQGQSDTLKVVITAGGGPSPAYQWVVNGSPLADETGSTLISSNLFNNDSVACIVTGSGACGGLPTSHSVIMNIHSLGVSSVTGSGSDIRVVPNPNKGTFTIKGTIGSASDEEVSVEISNMLGQTVYHNTVTTHNGKLEDQVQMNKGLPNGVYLLNVRTGSENNVFHFVVEQ